MKLVEIAAGLPNDEPAAEPHRFKVYLMGNWFDGRNFNYGGRKFVVPGDTAEDALRWIKNHKVEIYHHFRDAKAISGRYLLPHNEPIEKNLFLDKTHVDRPTEDDIHRIARNNY